MEAGIVRNDSEQNTNEFVLTDSAGNSAREPNDVEQRHNDGTRSADALTGAPTLVPIGTHDQEQSSPVNKSARSRSHPLMVTRLGPIKKIGEFNDCLNLRSRSKKPRNA